VAGARNEGILTASSEYISLLDDDDERLPGTLDLQLTALRESDAALIYGQALFAGATDRLSNDRYPLHCPSGDIFWQLLTQNFIPSGSVIFRRSCLEHTGMFNGSLPGIDDWDLWIRIAANYPFAALDQPVVTWRRPAPISDQGSARAVEMVTLSTRQFREAWVKMSRVAEAPREMRRRATRQFSQNMASHLASEALRCLSYGQVLGANRCVLAALRFHSHGLAGRALHELKSKTVSRKDTKLVSPLILLL
jgi:glycosyltransferase involved in cell wall biosynthesis